MPQSQPEPERELTAAVPLARPDGSFNPASHGWCRQPLVDCAAIGNPALAAHYGKNKRWEYWCIMTPDHIIACSIASLDRFTAHEVWVLDRSTKQELVHSAIGFGEDGARNCTLAASVDADAHARGDDFALDIIQSDRGTHLRAAVPGVSFDILAVMPPGHERMGVVVPWTEDLFQYTVKDVCRPAVGTLTIGDRTIKLDAGDCWAVLDHGRGRWPAEIAWNWGTGSGQSACGRVVGLQVGGRWTDGTGSTENAVLINTRLYKISTPLVWEYDTQDWMAPWRVRGGGLDAVLTPFYDKYSKVDAQVSASETHQLFGYWSGSFDTGSQVVKFHNLVGFAEDVWRRW